VMGEDKIHLFRRETVAEGQRAPKKKAIRMQGKEARTIAMGRPLEILGGSIPAPVGGFLTLKRSWGPLLGRERLRGRPRKKIESMRA